MHHPEDWPVAGFLANIRQRFEQLLYSQFTTPPHMELVCNELHLFRDSRVVGREFCVTRSCVYEQQPVPELREVYVNLLGEWGFRIPEVY